METGHVTADNKVAKGQPWTIVLAGSMAIAALWGAIFLALAQFERIEFAGIDRNLDNLARSFAGHVERSLYDIDQLLQTMATLYTAGERQALTDLMERRIADDRMFVLLAFLNAAGDVVLSTPPGGPVNIADREHFKVHRDHDDLGLFCGKPVVGRISKKLSIQLTRRLPLAGGPFAGVLTAGVDPEYFTQYYSQFDIGDGGLISLVGLDGVVRARFVRGGASAPGVGANVGDSPMLNAVRRQQSGTVRMESVVDKVPRMFAYRRLTGYPLYVVVGMSDRVALADLQQRRQTFLTFGGSVSTALAILTAILAWQSARLRQAWLRELATVADLQLASKVFEESANGILITDSGNRILKVNRAFCEITGYTAEEVIGQNPRMLNSGRTEEERYHEMWLALNQHGHWSGEIVNRRKNGGEYAEWLMVSAIHDGQGRLTNYVGLFSYADFRKFDAGSLHFLVHYDLLTELPNRLLLSDRLNQALASAVRNSRRVAVMFIDLDGFKPVNDTFGHEMGDEVLRQTAVRLRSILRQTDTLARYGGDEFVLVVPDTDQPDEAMEIAAKCRAACARPFLSGDHNISISASIGVAFFPEDGADEATLIAAADAAMYREKRQVHLEPAV